MKDKGQKRNSDSRILTISYYSSYSGLMIGLFEIKKIGYYKSVQGSEKKTIQFDPGGCNMGPGIFGGSAI